MTKAALTHTSLDLPDVLPESTDFLDVYQEGAWAQVRWDEDKTTIRGTRPLIYMANGVVEEAGELFEADEVEPDYNRLGALLSTSDGTIPVLSAGNATPSAITRHTKEFGDVSWYTANTLHLIGVRMSQAYKIGRIAWQLDDMTQLRSTPAFISTINRTIPGLRLLGISHELSEAAKILCHQEDNPAERNFVIASGKFILASMLVASSRFGTSYQEFLRGNQAKIDKRIADGTVFDKSGGDDR